ncbi:hypothetical protein FIA58_006625 [Flavobacterium jejuense]|uniref:Uncharacterized protein n=1 Tax=Flavobacterium jejuense TaxID=1544455 RepID=A0ABX0IS86_9FLAO|nr:hypothetical protein [Flavobacterium jejuense]NHN25348.1 hypothetical protein [Flavobacterium jejuense]
MVLNLCGTSKVYPLSTLRYSELQDFDYCKANEIRSESYVFDYDEIDKLKIRV